MVYMVWIKIKELLSFKGRIDRIEYLIVQSILFLLACLLGVFEKLNIEYIHLYKESTMGIIVLLFILLWIYLNAAVFIKRMHDISVSGWFLLPMIFIFKAAPPLYIVASLILLFAPGTKGINKYGINKAAQIGLPKL